MLQNSEKCHRKKGSKALNNKYEMIGRLAKQRKEGYENLLAEIRNKEESISLLKQQDHNLMLKIIELQNSVDLKENEYTKLKSENKSLYDKIQYMNTKNDDDLKKINSTTAIRSVCSTRRKHRLLKPTVDDSLSERESTKEMS